MDSAECFYTLEDLQSCPKPGVWNWNITSRIRKEHDISSIKRRGCNTAELYDEWKLFYSGVVSTQSAQAGVAMLVSPQLAGYADECISPGGKVRMLRLKLLGGSLCLIQVYATNLSAPYPEFMEKTSHAMRRFQTNESTMILRVCTGWKQLFGMWKGVIGEHGDANINDHGRILLQLCCDNALCIVNTFFLHREIRKYAW